MTMIMMVKHLGSLRPADGAGDALLAKVKHGEFVKVDLTRPRNVQHHRLFWALMSLVHQNQSRFPTVESLVDAIKVYVGMFDRLELRDGTVVAVPRSISFASMDQTAFSEFFDRVVHVVTEHIIPGTSNEALRRELELMTGAAA